MPNIRRVAVMINLDWPVVHHHHIVAGIQRYARESGRWDCSINPYADLLLQGHRRKAGVDRKTRVLTFGGGNVPFRARLIHAALTDTWNALGIVPDSGSERFLITVSAMLNGDVFEGSATTTCRVKAGVGAKFKR